MKLIDKDKVTKEIERRVKAIRKAFNEQGILEGVDRTYANAQYDAFKSLLTFLDTLEVKDVNTWHLQEKENIYDAVKDWSLQTFACVMKDGTIQKFTGNLDEDYEGHINVHIYGANDDYDNVDDIVKWIEFT